MSRIARCARHYWFCARDPCHFGGTFKQRERFNDAVFIAPDRAFLFTKNEKCGNNTARRTLQFLVAKTPLPEDFVDTQRWTAPLLQPSDLGLKRIAEINETIPFKFAIVRNPYVRVLSVYLNKFHGRGAQSQKFAKAIGSDPPASFAEFVSLIGKQTPEEMDPHWRVQYHNIYCDLIKYDTLVRFENYETEFYAVLEKLFGTAKIQSVRKRAVPTEEKLAGFYTADIAKAVRDIFRIDFEYFGYPVEPPI